MNPLDSGLFTDPPIKIASYEPPQQGFLSYLPASWVPYAELIRLTRPIGVVIIHCPFLLGSLFASAVSKHPRSLYAFIKVELILFTATIFLRGAVVAFNDLADRDIDGNVARTQHRPLARKAISPFKACVFVIAQAAMWLAILARLSPTSLSYAVVSLGFAVFYSYSKRILDFSPVVLGFTMAWGVFIGCAAMGTDPIGLVLGKSQNSSAIALFSLYLCCAIWTTIYEIIYAFQDAVDDEKHGVRSMAVRLRGKAKLVLSLLAMLQVYLFACVGWLLDVRPLFFASSCFGMSMSLGTMIWKVDLSQPKQCWWWFSNGTWFVGGSIIAGLAGQI